LFVAVPELRRTRDRLLAAASTLFAERGFHATTVRDIAERAGVNVAAANYHYGSKKALYLEVLRAQFAAIRAELVRRRASRPANELARLGTEELGALLRSRVKVMLDILIGPPPGLHGTLMHREMCDPSEALPVIVTEFIEPMLAEMQSIVEHLAPGLDAETVERCVHSITGQALFYRTAMPAMLHLQGRRAYRRTFTRELADHITAFTLGGMERLRKGKRDAG
jgi:AcrR family transcriptional regulator